MRRRRGVRGSYCAHTSPLFLNPLYQQRSEANKTGAPDYCARTSLLSFAHCPLPTLPPPPPHHHRRRWLQLRRRRVRENYCAHTSPLSFAHCTALHCTSPQAALPYAREEERGVRETYCAHTSHPLSPSPAVTGARSSLTRVRVSSCCGVRRNPREWHAHPASEQNSELVALFCCMTRNPSSKI